MLLVWSQVDIKRGTVGENDNPGSNFFARFIPAGTSTIVMLTQLVSLGAYVVFPDAGLKDVVTAVRTYPRSSKIQSGDQVWIMRLSCVLRLIQGASAMIATLLLILTSNTVVDIILNFTAVSFISNLDDYGYHLAVSGELGPELEAEANRLAVTDLPPCMQRNTVPKYIYNRIVQLLVFLLLFGMAIVVIVAQKGNSWKTQILRVQFQEETGLTKYSGCFKLNDRRWSQRVAYKSSDIGDRIDRNASFGYCRESRKWVFYKGTDDDFDPCDAKTEKVELALSAKTDTFDIVTSFDESWVSSSNTPLDLFFFQDEDDIAINDHCNDFLGDGICDPYFNNLDYNFDGGDCCAATCTGSKCGRRHLLKRGLRHVFNQSIDSGTSFSYCIDPKMVPITIEFNSIVSSRDLEHADYGDLFFAQNKYNEKEWRNETPVSPYFALDCDEKDVLELFIDKTMEHNSETMMIQDGANCTLILRNSTNHNSPDTRYDDPIWFVNYTVYHGDKDDVKKQKIEILTQNSNETEEETFRRIPICYFRKLGIIENFYTRSDPSSKAIDWLMGDYEVETLKSECEDDAFIERYALVNMYLAMGAKRLISRDKQCRWKSIICDEGQVTEIKLNEANLNKDIPSEIGLLGGLMNLELSDNGFSLIPTEIRKLTSLSRLSMNNNSIALLPTDLKNMAKLKELRLSRNDITNIPIEIISMASLQVLTLSWNLMQSIPTEIGLMTNLQELILDSNEIVSLPRQIGNMSSLQLMSLVKNLLPSIPTEVGLMTSLEELSVEYNEIASIPTQIGLLANLKKLDLHKNRISFLPTEFGLMTNLERLLLGTNNISYIPTESGLMKNLKEFFLGSNSISFVPSEIGRMENMEQLSLEYNWISSIPTELGRMEMMEQLSLKNNRISSIPTELGLMKNVTVLILANNEITTIPTEIGLMKKMETLLLGNNYISSVPTEFWKMTGLKQLELSNNAISMIPTEIGLMKKMETLFFDRNNVTVIPTEIGLLTGLKKIWFYSNFNTSGPFKIGMSIPSEIGLLTSLEDIIGERTKLHSLPSEIGKLTNLKNISFCECT